MALPRIRPELLLAFILLLGLAHALFVFDAPFEDSFITYRYAEHFAHGDGLTYNPGEIVEGFTSFGWTVLLAGVARLGLNLVDASRAMSLVFGMLILGVAARTARRWSGRGDVAAPVALLVAANGTWAYYAMTGMETTLFVLLVGMGLLEASSDAATSEARPGVFAALFFAAAAWVRPEGVGYFGLTVFALLGTRADRRRVPWFVGTFAGLFVPYFLWRWHHFGFLLPNTYYAKASPSSDVFRNGAIQDAIYFTKYLFWFAPLASFFLLRTSHFARAWRIASFVIVGGALNVVLVGGDTFMFYRFLLPAIPVGAIAMTVAAYDLAEGASRSTGTRALLRAAPWCLAALNFAVEFVPLRGPSEVQRFADVRGINQDYFVVGSWLRDNFPGKTIATNAAGIVPYVSGLPTIDMLGLNDTHIAHVNIRLGQGTVGHEKHDAAYVLSKHPDVILLGLPSLMKRALHPGELESAVARWYPFLPGDRDVFENPIFREEYAPLGIELAPGKFALFFVRKGE